jgi:hypothetical protein
MFNKTKRQQKRFPVNQWHKAQLSPRIVTAGQKFRLLFVTYCEQDHETESYATNRVYTQQEIDAVLDGKPLESMSHTKWEVMLGTNSQKPDLLTITAIRRAEWAMPEWVREYMEKWQGFTRYDPPSPTKELYLEKRKANDPKFDKISKLRQLQNKGIRNELTEEQCKCVFGCPHQDLIQHIEGTFQQGFAWSNRGSAWELDHIKPMVSFDAFSKQELLSCLHYSNLQALSVEENKAKWCN